MFQFLPSIQHGPVSIKLCEERVSTSRSRLRPRTIIPLIGVLFSVFSFAADAESVIDKATIDQHKKMGEGIRRDWDEVHGFFEAHSPSLPASPAFVNAKPADQERYLYLAGWLRLEHKKDVEKRINREAQSKAALRRFEIYLEWYKGLTEDERSKLPLIPDADKKYAPYSHGYVRIVLSYIAQEYLYLKDPGGACDFFSGKSSAGQTVNSPGNNISGVFFGDNALTWWVDALAYDFGDRPGKERPMSVEEAYEERIRHNLNSSDRGVKWSQRVQEWIEKVREIDSYRKQLVPSRGRTRWSGMADRLYLLVKADP